VRNSAEGRELALARWGMPTSQQAIFEAKKRARALEAKGKPVDFPTLLRVEPDGGTTNIRDTASSVRPYVRGVAGDARPKLQGGDRLSHRTKIHAGLIAAALAEVPDIILPEQTLRSEPCLVMRAHLFGFHIRRSCLGKDVENHEANL
jgi:hypothetical protein